MKAGLLLGLAICVFLGGYSFGQRYQAERCEFIVERYLNKLLSAEQQLHASDEMISQLRKLCVRETYIRQAKR